MQTSTKDIEIIIETENNLTININKNDLIQVIHIIINNAIDAFDINKITDKTIKIGIKKLDDKFIVDIRDNAGGIEEKNLHRIFEPYFTTKNQFQSSSVGIGLYLAKKILKENLNGILLVANIHNGVSVKIIL